MARPKVEFWFEFASTYSYLSALRLPELARDARIEIIWRPFLLGPIFAAQGWDTSPFNIYAAKGRYMWRDMARRAAAQGLDFNRPDPFPQNSVLAARTALIALQGKHGIAFCQNVFLAQFDAGADISDPDVIAACAVSVGLPQDIVATAGSLENKHALRAATEEAMRRGLFGAPSFAVGDELFWGDDRLEDALHWAAEHPA